MEIFTADENDRQLLENLDVDLRDIFIVSHAGLSDSAASDGFKSLDLEGLTVRVTRASGEKCSRCWKYDPTVGDDKDHEDVCSRCLSSLEKIL